MNEATQNYPVRFSVEYPEQGSSRVKALFRLFLLIPIVALWFVLDNISTHHIGTAWSISIATALVLLFRRKYPRWWFDFQLEFSRFVYRIFIYMWLMRDEYPSTDEAQAVTLEIDYPDAMQLNRFLPLVKWLLAIPHLLVLIVLTVGALLAVVFAWFAILFTARYPRGVFNYLEGVNRWWARVDGYAFLLVTDQYPPFSLK